MDSLAAEVAALRGRENSVSLLGPSVSVSKLLVSLTSPFYIYRISTLA
jgi:hypothetical protein